MRFVMLSCLIVLLSACVTIPERTPDQVRNKTVSEGERTRVASHGRWKNTGTKCFARRTPELRLVQPPAHGGVDFGTLVKTPERCGRGVEHAAVYYTPRAGHLGSDSFSYLRINPDSAKNRLILVRVTVGLSTAEIREIQSRLAELGFEPGPLDGISGPRTRRAIEAYQTAKGLEVTGTPSSDLLASLRKDA